MTTTRPQPRPARLTRRGFCLSGMAATLPAALPARLMAADAARDLGWKDLVPREVRGFSFNGRAQSHSIVPDRTFSDPRHYAVVPELDGLRVRLPGYLIPLEFDGTGATEFLLVPFVGACIHVPPPPPNQIVHVTTAKPHQVQGLFEPVYAVGTLRTVLAETDLAAASYSLSAERFDKVSFD